MGWTNFIVVPKLKLIIEISRHINDLDDYQTEALNYLTNEERMYEIENQDIGEKELKKVSVKDFSIIFQAYDKANDIAGMEVDKLFLYWLENRKIDYEIKTEFEMIKEVLDQYKIAGYTILRMFGDE